MISIAEYLDNNYFICIHNIDSTYLYVNGKCYEYTGYQADELIGKSPYDLFHPRDIKEFLINTHQRIFNDNKIYLNNYRIVHKTLKTVWMSSMLYAFHNQYGKLRYFVSLNKKSLFNQKHHKDFPDTTTLEKYLLSIQHKMSINTSVYLDHFFPLNGQFVFRHDILKNVVDSIVGIKFLLGYDENMINDAEFMDRIIHEDDRSKVKMIMQKGLDLFKTEPVPFKNQLSVIYRVKRLNGDYIHVLRQMTQFEVDDHNNLVSCLNICSDISYLSFIHHVSYEISGPGNLKSHFFELNRSKDNCFSKRELQILNLIYAGNNSGEISKKLNIAKNTVNTHRRNMLKKTHMRNSHDLIKYAINENLLQ